MTANEPRLADAAPTLAIGGAGAALFWLIGFPAPMLTGPAAAVSLAAFLGLPCHVPTALREAVFLVLGTSIGSTVTPEVIATARAWPVSLVILLLTLLAVLAIGRALLVRGFGFDRLTALLSATPGHLSYVLSLSADLPADVARVALVQSVRVLLLTLAVPVLITLWGIEGLAETAAPERMGLLAMGVIFGIALVLGHVFRRLKVPAAQLLAAMVVSGTGHGADLAPGILPPWLTILAFVAMGSLIGTRFRGTDPATLPLALLAGLVTTVVACAVAALGAGLAAMALDIPPAALFLAFAPGGVEVMAAIAVDKALEPAFVAAHHVARLVMLSILMPLLLMRVPDRGQ